MLQRKAKQGKVRGLAAIREMKGTILDKEELSEEMTFENTTELSEGPSYGKILEQHPKQRNSRKDPEAATN